MPLTPTQADIDHAVFVRQAYRYSDQIDATVKARNPQARQVALDSNLDQTSAVALAVAFLAENHQPRAFEVTLEDAKLPVLLGGPPSLILNDKRVGDLAARKTFSITVDYENNRTTHQVRG